MEFTKRYGRALVPALALGGATLLPAIASAEDTVSTEMFTVNNLWMMIAAALVFITFFGFSAIAASAGEADLLLVNTCAVTAEAVRRLGYRVGVVADPHTADGLVEAVIDYYHKEQ